MAEIIRKVTAFPAAVRGNIDIFHRPIVHNPDGSISTVRTIRVTDDRGRSIIIPTAVGGRIVSDQQAINHFRQTGQHLGIFKNDHTAAIYDALLHQMQSMYYVNR